MEITIILTVDEGDPSVDKEHDTGLTNDAYERLTMGTAEHGAGSLAWLGEVSSVQVTSEDAA